MQGQICDIQRPQLAVNRFLPLWPHRFPPFGYIHLGGRCPPLLSEMPICPVRGISPLIICLQQHAPLTGVSRPTSEKESQNMIIWLGVFVCVCAIRARKFCKRLKKESILPACVAWRAGTSNRFVVPAHRPGNRFLGSLKDLQIRDQPWISLTKYIQGSAS